jgi:hypothetical protein
MCLCGAVKYTVADELSLLELPAHDRLGFQAFRWHRAL